MFFFRINIYLKILELVKVFFVSKKNLNNKIYLLINKNIKKKFIKLTSMGRVAFLYILLFLKAKNSQKNEVIISAYNLPLMINIIRKLKLKVKFININFDTGLYELSEIKKKINKNTLAIVITNFFNSYENIKNIQKYCDKNKIDLIEDSAIFFDNYKLLKNKKVFSGSIGHFSFFSFNIMKNVPSLYGGAIATNNQQFNDFFLKQTFNKFSSLILLKQVIIFFFLKLMSINFLYNLFVFKLVKIVYKNNIKFFLQIFYPILKKNSLNLFLPSYYFSELPLYQKRLLFLKLNNTRERNMNFFLRKKKNIYYFKKLSKSNNLKFISLFKVKDFNFQNFLDFPIKVKFKEELFNYLLDNDIEVKKFHYVNCDNKKNNNAQKLQESVICLPNGKKITFKYIDYIINKINLFYKTYEYSRASSKRNS